MLGSKKTTVAAAAVVALTASLAACGGAGGGGSAASTAAGSGSASGSSSSSGGSGGGGTVKVLMVNNPQMEDLKQLAPEFTKKTGIKVEFTDLPENDVRDKIQTEFTQQAGQYDVASLSNFEIPLYGKKNWVAPLDDYIKNDSAFNQDDILKPMATSLSVDGKVYGEPFYGESSFLMYRKDVLAAKGVTLSANPTWDEVAAAAAKVDGAQQDMKGICLRGLPGWGQVFAPLTTVVNTFGGTWYDEGWNAKVNDQPFKDAVNFYVNLIKAHGEPGASQAGFTECLNAATTGKVAMWYDATSAAGSLESADSPTKGKWGYAAAPVKNTKSAGWLYTWAWAIENASQNKDNAWKFISWASSKEYEELVGAKLGWARVPAGKRASTYSNADYLKVASSFAQPTKSAIESADPMNPGVQKRPAPGIQFVDFEGFPAMATTVSQDVSSAIAGKMSVDDALNKGQETAQQAGNDAKANAN